MLAHASFFFRRNRVTHAAHRSGRSVSAILQIQRREPSTGRPFENAPLSSEEMAGAALVTLVCYLTVALSINPVAFFGNGVPCSLARARVFPLLQPHQCKHADVDFVSKTFY